VRTSWRPWPSEEQALGLLAEACRCEDAPSEKCRNRAFDGQQSPAACKMQLGEFVRLFHCYQYFLPSGPARFSARLPPLQVLRGGRLLEGHGAALGEERGQHNMMLAEFCGDALLRSNETSYLLTAHDAIEFRLGPCWPRYYAF